MNRQTPPSPQTAREVIAQLCSHLATVADGLGYRALGAKLAGISAAAAETEKTPNLSDALRLQTNPDRRDVDRYIRGLRNLRGATTRYLNGDDANLLEWILKVGRAVPGLNAKQATEDVVLLGIGESPRTVPILWRDTSPQEAVQALRRRPFYKAVSPNENG